MYMYVCVRACVCVGGRVCVYRETLYIPNVTEIDCFYYLIVLAYEVALQHTATHCNTLQHTATPCNTATHCSTLQHTAAHCNTRQHTATEMHHTATHCNTLHHTAAYCSILHLDAPRHPPHHLTGVRVYVSHCNTLQMYCNTLPHGVLPTANHCSVCT